MEIDAIWRRYAELQEELFHLAQDAVCRVIVGEWLGNLRSRGRTADLNRRINSQICSLILEKLRYKARRVGVRVVTVWSRGTSRRCPRCGTVQQKIKDHPPGTSSGSAASPAPRRR